MQLSELVYNTVKNVKYLEDNNFSYESFIRGDFDNDIDYANSINNVFTPLNEAIHRLSDLNKIKHKIESLGKPSNNGIIELGTIAYDIKNIINIFTITNGDYNNTQYREFGRDKIMLIDYIQDADYYIEYIQDIKHFSKSDIYIYEVENEVFEHNDVDLTKYGITNTMCSYIIEYCQGKLLEPIAPELANMHLTRAEQYFNDLDSQQTSFFQKSVKRKYRIEWYEKKFI